MKSIRNRVIYLIMVFSILLMPCGCGLFSEESPQTEDSFPTAETKDESYDAVLLDSLDDEDFGGASFRIATDDLALIFPENSSNLVNREIYDRNKAVEEKYHVKLVAAEGSGLPTIAETLRLEALAGTDYCDLALLGVKTVQLFQSFDVLMNVKSVPYIDTLAPYFFSDASDALTLGSTQYGLCGDFTYYPNDVYVCYFNRDLIAKTALPDLYELVKSNEWDFENFLLYAEEINALGKVDGWKVYGYTSPFDDETLTNVFWAAGGIDFLRNEYGTRPQLIYHNDTSLTLMKSIQDFLYESGPFFSNTNTAVSNFALGRILFCIAPLSMISNISNTEIDWGVVPIPKLDINQERYYSFMDLDYQVACFLKGTANLKMSGMITSALFASSYQKSIDRFMMEYLNAYLPSNDAGLMVKQAVSTPYFDPAFFFGNTYPPYSAATYTLVYRIVSNNGNFDSLYKQYSALFEKFLDEENIK